MSSSNPPSPYTPNTYNPSAWKGIVSTITTDYLDENYLRYKYAQGLENFVGVVNTGDLTQTGASQFGTAGSNTGIPTCVADYTALPSTDSSTKIPTTAWVQTAVGGSANPNQTPNSITMTPTTNPPTTDSCKITNYYNNGASYALNIRTAYYLNGSAAGTRRQNFVNVCWDNSLSPSVYQLVVLEYKNYMCPDDNLTQQPQNGKITTYDYGTITFSPAWLKQQYGSTGITISTANNSVISFTPCSRGSINNGSWTLQCNVVAEYLGSSYNYITLYFNNSPISTSGGAGAINTWCSFNVDIKNNSNNSSYPLPFPVWFQENITTTP
jgi:hypothetical protein